MFFQYQELPRFNSAASCDLLEAYSSGVEDQIRGTCARVKSRAFAPSGFRCDRYQWFKLRGTEVDEIPNPDAAMDFMADVGTAIHKRVQRTLIRRLGDDWISVRRYLDQNPMKFEYILDEPESEDEYETLISIISPPVKFACDGIVRIDGKLYLLEIKTCDLKSIESLSKPKDSHMDQIRCYSSLLGLRGVLVLYVDRQLGTTKCFEVRFTDDEHKEVIDKMYRIMDMAERNLAPEKLSVGGYMCSNCAYQLKCKEW